MEAVNTCDVNKLEDEFPAGAPATLTGRDPCTGSGIAVKADGATIVQVEACEKHDDCWLSTGLVDLQVNGYAGIDLNDGELTVENVRHLACTLLSLGVTRFLPTLITASESRLLRTLEIIARACREDALLSATVPMIHIEGPCISPEDGPRGAHPLAHVRAPSLPEVERWQRACDNRIGLITFSPHWPDSAAFIKGLRQQGIRVALGHTHATHEQLLEAVDAGASLSTHLGNGIAAMLPRHPNPLWTQLADDRLDASFIADGHHLPRETLTAMLRAKGRERCLLISDTAALGGMPPGRYKAPIGGDVELTATGRLSVADTPFLAGAAKPLSDAVAYCASLDGMSLEDALYMASSKPGSFLDQPQLLCVGQPADIFSFRWNDNDVALTILKVMKAGRIITSINQQKTQ